MIIINIIIVVIIIGVINNNNNNNSNSFIICSNLILIILLLLILLQIHYQLWGLLCEKCFIRAPFLTLKSNNIIRFWSDIIFLGL